MWKLFKSPYQAIITYEAKNKIGMINFQVRYEAESRVYAVKI